MVEFVVSIVRSHCWGFRFTHYFSVECRRQRPRSGELWLQSVVHVLQQNQRVFEWVIIEHAKQRFAAILRVFRETFKMLNKANVAREVQEEFKNNGEYELLGESFLRRLLPGCFFYNFPKGPRTSMALYTSAYLALKGLPISILWGICMCCKDTWTPRAWMGLCYSSWLNASWALPFLK